MQRTLTNQKQEEEKDIEEKEETKETSGVSP